MVLRGALQCRLGVGIRRIGFQHAPVERPLSTGYGRLLIAAAETAEERSKRAVLVAKITVRLGHCRIEHEKCVTQADGALVGAQRPGDVAAAFERLSEGQVRDRQSAVMAAVHRICSKSCCFRASAERR